MIQAGRTDQILAEVQDHILCFIKVEQLIIAHMLQVQLINIVPRVNIMQNALQARI